VAGFDVGGELAAPRFAEAENQACCRPRMGKGNRRRAFVALGLPVGNWKVLAQALKTGLAEHLRLLAEDLSRQAP
jgi:hypothetical protein